MSAVTWLEDDFQPRVDELVKPLRWWSQRLPVAHPEWFQPGDIVRVTVTSEAVFVRSADLKLMRAVGSLKRRRAAAGTQVFILGMSAGRRQLTYRRWWWRPWRRRLVAP